MEVIPPWLYPWLAVLGAVATVAGLGVSLVGEGTFWIAKLCFAVGAVLLSLALVRWIVGGARWPASPNRFALAVIGAAVVAACLVEALAWVTRQQQAVVRQPSAQAPASVERQASPDIGSLAFVSLTGELNRQGDIANPQMSLHFRNVTSRLLKFEVQKLELEIASKKSEPLFINRGGYVYASQESEYRCNYVKDVPLLKEPLPGTIEYAIAYTVAGSNVVHHTAKKIRFNLYYSGSLGGKFSFLEGHED